MAKVEGIQTCRHENLHPVIPAKAGIRFLNFGHFRQIALALNISYFNPLYPIAAPRL